MSPSLPPVPPATKRRAGLAVLYACAGLLVVGLIFAVASTYTLTAAIRAQQQENAKTNKTLLSCSIPSGSCAKKQAAQIARATANIGDLATYAAACADQPGVQTAAQIKACVLTEVKRQGHR